MGRALESKGKKVRSQTDKSLTHEKDSKRAEDTHSSYLTSTVRNWTLFRNGASAPPLYETELYSARGGPHRHELRGRKGSEQQDPPKALVSVAVHVARPELGACEMSNDPHPFALLHHRSYSIAPAAVAMSTEMVHDDQPG